MTILQWIKQLFSGTPQLNAEPKIAPVVPAVPKYFKTKPKRNVTKVFIHCSASDNPAHDGVEIIREWHLARGFNDIGYHYYIAKDGSVEKGRSLSKIPAAQKGHNTGSIAICVGGLNNFSDAQMKSLVELCKEINEAYDFLITFHGHREVEPKKTCPVFDYKSVLNLDSKGYMNNGDIL